MITLPASIPGVRRRAVVSGGASRATAPPFSAMMISALLCTNAREQFGEAALRFLRGDGNGHCFRFWFRKEGQPARPRRAVFPVRGPLRVFGGQPFLGKRLLLGRFEFGAFLGEARFFDARDLFLDGGLDCLTAAGEDARFHKAIHLADQILVQRNGDFGGVHIHGSAAGHTEGASRAVCYASCVARKVRVTRPQSLRASRAARWRVPPVLACSSS